MSTDIIYPTSPSDSARDRLRQLIQRAKTATTHADSLRIAKFGDSTWTDVGGSGIHYHHYVVHKLGSLFGNIAGSRLMGVRSNAEGMPYCRITGLNALSSGIPTSYSPPGLSDNADHAAGLPAYGESASGYAPFYIYDGPPTVSFGTRHISQGTNLFPVHNQSVECYVARRPNSAEGIKVYYRPSNNSYQVSASIIENDGITVNDVDDTVLGFNSLIKVTTKQFAEVAGKPYPQYQFRSTEPATYGSGSVDPIILASCRVLNANPVGCMVDSFSAGSYRVRNWFGDTETGASALNVDAANQTVQYGHDMWMFGLGLNDFYNGVTAAQLRNDYYKPDGADNKGLMGELIAEAEAQGRKVPLIVIVVPHFRADGGEANYAAYKTQHELWATEAKTLVDTLRANGYDALVLDTHKYASLRGFNATLNDIFGYTDRGAYDTGGVSYNVNDLYTGTDGVQYLCLTAHTSATNTKPTDEFANSKTRNHMRARPHLGDVVHQSEAGAEIIADATTYLFASHYQPASTDLSPNAVSQIVDAITFPAAVWSTAEKDTVVNGVGGDTWTEAEKDDVINRLQSNPILVNNCGPLNNTASSSTLKLITGDSYLAAQSRQVVIDKPAGYPDLTTADSVKLRLRPTDANAEITFEVTGTAPADAASFDIPSASVNGLTLNTGYLWSAKAYFGSEVVTLQTGPVELVDGI